MIRVSEMNFSYHTDLRINQTEMNSSHIMLNNSLHYYTGPLMSPLEYHPAHLTLLLLVSCLGVVTNTISAMVWFAKIKSRTGAFFLGCLSGVDACFCLSMAVVKYMELADIVICNFSTVITITSILATTSRLLTLPIVAHRWVAVSRPLAMTRVIPLRLQVKVQACLAISLLPLHGVLIYSNILSCEYRDIKNIKLATWNRYFLIILFSWNTLMTTCLLVLNTLLLNAACGKKKIVKSHVTRDWQHRVQHRMTIIVLCMSVFSLLDNMMYLVDFLNAINIVTFHRTAINICVIIFQWAIILNNSMNFVFYKCFAKEFRHTLLSLCKGVAIRITRDCTPGQVY